MKTKILIILIISVINVFGQSNPKITPKYKDLSLDFETRTRDIVNQMTLDEKISQLGDRSPAIKRLNIPEYNWWNECLHGVARAGTATVFPQAIGMAATFDTAMMKKVADIISDEARAKHNEAIRKNWHGRYTGLTFWSPNINIFRDPRWGRGHETYGEDPYLTGQMGIQFVKGLQGNHPKYLKLVATAKHFAVHNGPESQRHTFNAVPNTRDLWETYLPAFKDLMVDAKTYSIMGAYNRVDGESASASWLLLQDILRNKWDFDGYVVSDCGAINDIHANHKISNSAAESAAIGIRKGCDLNCGDVYQNHLKEAIKLGLIDEGEIDLAVYRLMLARMKLGMFDPVEMVPYAKIPIEVNNSKLHDEMALIMAQKSMTLLKNNGILPLNKNKIKRIAVVGPNADNLVALRANYHGDASAPVTILKGIKNKVGLTTEVTYAKASPLVVRENRTIEPRFLHHVDRNGKKQLGLFGRFYNNKDLEGEPIYSRVDHKIDFLWWQHSPNTTLVGKGLVPKEQIIQSNSFSAKWTGQLLAPKTGTYTFDLESMDGSRLYINNKLIADNWSVHQNFKTVQGKIDLKGGKSYDIKVEYYNVLRNAAITVRWEVPKNDEVLNEEIAKIISDVKKADIAVFVGGLNADWEGEEMSENVKADGFYRGDRTKIELPEIQRRTLKAMLKTGTPVVLVLMGGSAISLDGLENELEAILMSWYPGQRGGDAVADVLFGDYNPAGRLPVTFYKSTNDLPDFSDYNMRAGKGFTYRYFKEAPLYPFGHGLSYTKFEYSNLEINKTQISSEDKIKVSVNIKNAGKFDGDEVVQLYVKDLKSDKWMPMKQLRKFERIALKKGEAKTLEFVLDPIEDMRYYDAMLQKYMVESGEFEIQIGGSSEDIRLKQIINVK
ncbi:glycoside hydrolase family 3 protein [Polaribacter sp. SA4-12]|uniref:glycoside hydrolase family 3 protein n=1 Tax=Polaribacter sp. SA4-12 TaxID=1312072 RepID=UPI000B3CB3D8|nr:glycoside hydrolase family 3 protein [Polaribacter sp. SA4-12]ARV16546.1 hypothetical protein BTO07_15990 [Polaribacter sp. SA4-12]